MVLLDTAILIDVLRGRAPAVAFVMDLDEPVGISVLTVAELFVGVQPNEEEALHDLIGTLDVWPLDAKTAQCGGRWRQQYGPSHHVSLVDALLAATAVQHQARLATPNLKHFPMLPDAFLPYTL